MEEQEIVCVHLCVCVEVRGPWKWLLVSLTKGILLAPAACLRLTPWQKAFGTGPQQETALAHLLCTQGCREVGEEHLPQRNPQ